MKILTIMSKNDMHDLFESIRVEFVFQSKGQSR